MISRRAGQFYPKADSSLGDAELRSLAGASQAPARELLISALGSRGFHPRDMVPLDSGTFNSVWRFRSGSGDLVVKASHTSDTNPLAVETAVSDVLDRHGVSHPRIHILDDSRSVLPFAFVVMDFVDGRSMRSFDSDEEAVQLAIPALASAFRSIHTIPTNGYGLAELRDAQLTGSHASWNGFLSTRVSEHLETLRAHMLITDTEAREFIASLDVIPPISRPRMLHGDCGPHNVMVSPAGTLSLIDWEDVTFGDPDFEIAMWATFNPPQRWNAMFGSYYGSGSATSSLFWPYFARITLAKVVVRTRLGYPDAPGRPSRRDRIQQSLDGLRSMSL